MSHERRFGRIAIILLLAILPCGLLLPLVNGLNVFLYATYAVPGALLAIRRPRNVIGWLLLTIAVGYLYISTSPTFDPVALASGRVAPYDLAIAWVNGWAGSATVSALLALIIVFPTGRLPRVGGIDRLWRRSGPRRRPPSSARSHRHWRSG